MNAPAIALVIVGGFAIAASWARLARVLRVATLDLELTTAFVKRQPGRVATLASAIDLDEGDSLGELARGLAENEERARAAACNEALHDVSVDLAWGESIPTTMLRLCLFAAGLALVASVALHLSLGEQVFELVGISGGAVIFVTMCRREADRLAKKARADVDAWVRASTRSRGDGGNVASV